MLPGRAADIALESLVLPRACAQSSDCFFLVTCLSHRLCLCPVGSKAHRRTIQTTPKFRLLEEVLSGLWGHSPCWVSKKGSSIAPSALGYSKRPKPSLVWLQSEVLKTPSTYKTPHPVPGGTSSPHHTQTGCPQPLACSFTVCEASSQPLGSSFITPHFVWRQGLSSLNLELARQLGYTGWQVSPRTLLFPPP